MNRITDWIRRHQVAAFFILSYAVTWPLLILIYFVPSLNPIIAFLVNPIAVFSPAIAAMWISSISESQPTTPGNRPRLRALFVSWLLSAVISSLFMWQVEELELLQSMLIGGIYALFPAWILSSAYAKNPGIRKHFSTLVRLRGRFIWYLVAMFGFPVIQLLGAGISWILGAEVHIRLNGINPADAVIFLLLTFLFGFIFAGGVNEESGWRGFALPRLQARYPVIVAVAIVWFFWALWHLPYDIGREIPLESMLRNRIFYNFLWAIYISWVYNRTGGSILAPALFHPSINTFGDNLGPMLNLPPTQITIYLFAALAVFALIYDRMWKKLPPDHKAVYRSTLDPNHNSLARAGDAGRMACFDEA